MKLNNKQIEVIKKKIISQIDDKNKVLVDNYEKTQLSIDLKAIKNKSEIKSIEKLYSNKLVKTITFSSSELKDLLGFALVNDSKRGYECSYNISLEDFNRFLKLTFLYNFRKDNSINYKEQEIEDEIILSTIDNITDIDVLINSIVSKY